MSKLKLALIGYGHLGKWHAQKLMTHSECEFVGIVDPSEKSRQLAKEAFPAIVTYSNLDEVISKIDGAIIVTPTSFHFDVALKLIKANKHVFCEKPVTSTLEQGLALKKELGNKDIVIQVGHSERCHQIWENLKSEFGFATKAPKVVILKRTSPFKGRAADVGVVEDLMIHDIDIVRMLYGDPITVYAKGAKVITSNFDHVIVTLKYSDKLVTIEGSRVDVEVHRNIAFVSDDGILKVDLLNNKTFFSRNLTSAQDQIVESGTYEKRDHLLIEQQKFVQSILKKTPVFVSLEDGINALRIIDAINFSLNSNKEVSFS